MRGIFRLQKVGQPSVQTNNLAAYANNVVRNRAASSTISVTDKQGKRKAGEEITPNRLN